MKLIKKSVAVVLSALMLISMVTLATVFSASAADKTTVTLSARNAFFEDVTRTYSEGDTFDAVFSLQADKLVMNSQIYVKFDHTKLHVTGMTALGGGLVEKFASVIKNFSDTLQQNDDMVTANFSASEGTFEYMEKAEVLLVNFELLDASAPATIELDYYNLSVDGSGKGDEYLKLIDRANVDADNASTFSIDGTLTGGSEPEQPTETETATETATETVTESVTETATEPSETEPSETSTVIDTVTETETVTESVPTPTETATETVTDPTETVTDPEPVPTETASETTPVPTETATETTPAPTETVTETTPAPTETVTEPQPTEPVVKTPKLNKTKATLKAGKTVTLKVTNGTAKSWKSSKKSVAMVSKKGVVTALKKGTAKVTVTLTSGKKLSCTVKVSTSPTIKVGSKKFSKAATYTVNKGKTIKVKITGKAAGVNNSYATSAKKIAKVTSKKTAKTVVIKGYKKGKATITLKVNGVSFKIKVKVK